jgi:mono/diheme cytochrome c family protein
LEANDAFMLGVFLDLPFAVLQTFILCRLASLEHAGDLSYCLGRRYWPMAAALVAAAAILGTLGWHKLQREYPQQLVDDSIEEAFKYGSIGTENANGLPYWLWASLPSVFPEYLPRPGGYSGLGFLWEPGREMPVGFTRKKIGFDRVGLNCALCHAGSAQLPGEPRPRIYLGAEAVTADVLSYQRFLFACANDPRFNAATLMPAIGRLTRLSWIDSLTYRVALIPATRKALRAQAKLWTWTYEKDRPEWGPGRIEPFNPVKVSILQVKVGASLGTCDMQPLWRLGAIPGRALHWDGMNTDLREVVDSSALGDGATPQSIPRPFLRKIEAWIQTNAPPAFPFTNQINPSLLARGAELYRAECARCHAPGGEMTGKVMPVSGPDGVGTDDNRAKMWTPESAAAYNAYLGNRSWRFTHFRATGGYLNVPLDGLWLRAPYLHNGSVPTLADLLQPVANRPTVFWRGLNAYDPVKVGFVSAGPQAEAAGFRFDTTGRGNSNQGHLYGTTLSSEDKAALLEYLKTL